ncbi:SDR family NAD(P)-dependent oxidoreductase [Mycolicibacterium sphagni]|uniref:SDR family NAD(P)-dependent oxidoreductase n=1 Tax=Mycolicibacterium sphagni TaxID=1786 RepID=UPI0021F306B5|nr:SDR family oxidoreductase [Mycolicibacterium sphagni]MCV7180117.1 SDR family oxidoreductase [Mycolicibacterium sphagni]
MATLITGASAGLGVEYARQFAALGHDLVLVARREDALERLAGELRSAHNVDVTVVALDLSAPGAAAELVSRTAAAGVVVDGLINNAGFGTHGDVIDADPKRLTDEIALNCGTVVDLTARYLPGMRSLGRGTIVNIASTAAFQPLPHMAVYGATKAFVLSFTEALWAEEKTHGIRVLAVCPGATATEFFDVAGEAAAVGRKRTAKQVVDATMRELAGSKPSFVDGLTNGIIAHVLTRLTPRRLLIAVGGRVMGG